MANEEEVGEDEEGFEDEEKEESTFELKSQARMRKACIPLDEERRRNKSRRMRRRTVGGSITSILGEKSHGVTLAALYVCVCVSLCGAEELCR